MENTAIKLLKQVHSDICDKGEVSFNTSFAVTDFLMNLKTEEYLTKDEILKKYGSSLTEEQLKILDKN
jgi:hypothetical protein|tara:strand:+ start:24348 stop:24551 length:204 start_codon:yes stop_codon:yes gene_type:complete